MSRSRKKDYRVVPTSDNEENKAKYQKNLDEGLKPKMTLLNGCTVIIGSIIGSGIFVSPSGVLLNTGSVNMSLIVWVVSGLFSMISSYCGPYFCRVCHQAFLPRM